MANGLKIKRGDGAPVAGADGSNGVWPYELAWDYTNNKLYINDNGTMREIGGSSYSAGTNISLSGTTFNVDDAFLKNDASDTMNGSLTVTGTITVQGGDDFALGELTNTLRMKGNSTNAFNFLNNGNGWAHLNCGNVVAAGSVSIGGHAVNDIDIGSEFVDADDHLMTSGAIKEKIEDYGYTTNSGDITGVTAGTGLSGGGTSGGVTLQLDGTYLKENGSWTGDLVSDHGWSRVFTFDNGGAVMSWITKNNQMSTLIDGSYFAYEAGSNQGGGFWSSTSSDYDNAPGIVASAAAELKVTTADGGDSNLIVTGSVYMPNDNVTLGIGAGNDLRLFHDGTNSYIYNYQGELRIGNTVDDADTVFYGDDGSGANTPYLTLDGSATRTNVSKDLRLDDSVNLQLGSGGDCGFSHDGTDTLISNATGHLTIQTSADDKDLIFKCDNGSGGVTAYLTLDGSAVLTQFDKDTKHTDGVEAQFGNSADIKIYHNGGGNSNIENHSGHLYFTQYTDDGDIIFRTDNGSGGVSNYMVIDGGAETIDFLKNTRLAATKKLFLDGGGNTYIYEESADNVMFYIGGRNMLRLHEGNGEVVVNDSQVDTNFRVESDTIDDLLFCDAGNSRVGIGTNSPSYLLHVDGHAYAASSFLGPDGSAGTPSYRFHNDGNTGMYNVGGSDALGFSVGGNLAYQITANHQHRFYESDATTNYLEIIAYDDYIYLHHSAGNYFGFQTDSGRIDLGAMNASFAHIQTDRPKFYMNKELSVDTGIIGSYDENLQLQRASSSDDMIEIEASETKIYGDAVERCRIGSYGIKIRQDNYKLTVGAGEDASFYHDGTDSWLENGTGNLYIRNAADDKDVIFQCDNGSGGNETYLTLDGSSKESYFSTKLGIGTTNPNELLHINSSSGDARIMLNAPDGSDTEIKFFNNGSSVWTLGHDDGSGSFRLGTSNVDTNVAIDVNSSRDVKITESLGIGVAANGTTGRLDCSNDVVAYSTSDKRLKENIKPLDSALDKVMQISGVEFDWKKLTEKEKETIHGNEGHDVGVIAQEVEEVLPEVVTQRDSGYKAVKYEKIVPLLIEAIKELKQEIQELKNG